MTSDFDQYVVPNGLIEALYEDYGAEISTSDTVTEELAVLVRHLFIESGVVSESFYEPEEV